DAIELDARLTADGEVVVIHDDRLRRTTDGRGLVRNATLRELRRLSAGSWFHRRFGQEKIPTLHEVFELISNSLGIGLNIELKVSAGLRRRAEGEYLASRVSEIVRDHRAAPFTLISSFHRPTILFLKRKLPTLQGRLLIHP